MRRREFCLWLSAVTAMDLLSAKAQKPGKPVIGCLALGSFQDGRKTFDWVRRGLAETGFVEGRDFDVELRVADYQAERLRELAADLVARNVAIIVALTTPSTAAAEAITKSVPIVFFTGVDPVANGFVSSLNATPRAFSRSVQLWARSGLSCCTKSLRRQMSSRS